MRATTLVKFDATHQMKYNPPLNCRKHFIFNAVCPVLISSIFSKVPHIAKSPDFPKKIRTLVKQECSRMNTPPKLRFRLQMPFLYHPAGYVPVHFENNRVQLLQWLLPLYSMRKQSVYDSDWNFSYHPEPEESGHVMVTDFALEISLSSHWIN